MAHPTVEYVWFGQTPYLMWRIETELCFADLIIVTGRSGQVYPTADFVLTTKE